MVRIPKHFTPPHCPRPECLFHCSSKGWRWKKAGFHYRRHRPLKVQRYTCVDCGASFSFQSFQTSYWLKRPDLLEPVFHGIISCSSYRQIARQLGVSHTTVMRIAERLGRHCLLFQQRFLNRIERLEEPVVADGFETFEFSQYTPVHFHVAVGARTHFVYGFTDSELRRKGRMTRVQKARRAWLEKTIGRPDPKSIEKEMAELLRLLPEGEIDLRTDEHFAYPRAVRRSGRLVRHSVTSSKEARTAHNPLFPVNLWDLLIRHSSSNHKRETIAFSKRRQNAAEKLAALQVWRNFLKSFSEKKQDSTPAMRLGLLKGKLSVGDVLKERLFVSVIGLPVRLQRYYFREIVTRRIPNGRTHDCSLAF
jgi:transposase-like protein